MGKKTVVIGASTNPARYSYIASGMLSEYGHDIVPVGLKRGEVFGKEILDAGKRPVIDKVDTVTLYVGPTNQSGLFEYIMQLKPSRVIFNPGTENPELMRSLETKGIDVVEGCTLVMLRSQQY
jgi:predicted CoA-binding protein